MLIICPRCSEQGLTYRYDEVYCIVCAHREYTVPKELQAYADAERRRQIKRTKAWSDMRNRSKYAMKAVKVSVYDASSTKLRHVTPQREERR